MATNEGYSKKWGYMYTGKKCDGACQAFCGAETHAMAHHLSRLEEALYEFVKEYGVECAQVDTRSLIEQIGYELADEEKEEEEHPELRVSV